MTKLKVRLTEEQVARLLLGITACGDTSEMLNDALSEIDVQDAEHFVGELGPTFPVVRSTSGEEIALTRDAFNSTRKQLRSCCDDNVFASILTSAVIRAGLTARLKCAHIAGIRGFATAFSCQNRAADGVESSVKLPPRRTQNLRFLKLRSAVSVL